VDSVFKEQRRLRNRHKMHWYTDPKIFATIGLLFDMIGACLVAIEVVRVFHGPTTIDFATAEKKRDPNIKSVKTYGAVPTHEENPYFVRNEKKKRRFMITGLFFLLIGFALQIAAVWLQK
jgi:hypothetical protein